MKINESNLITGGWKKSFLTARGAPWRGAEWRSRNVGIKRCVSSPLMWGPLKVTLEPDRALLQDYIKEMDEE